MKAFKNKALNPVPFDRFWVLLALIRYYCEHCRIQSKCYSKHNPISAFQLPPRLGHSSICARSLIWAHRSNCWSSVQHLAYVTAAPHCSSWPGLLGSWWLSIWNVLTPNQADFQGDCHYNQTPRGRKKCFSHYYSKICRIIQQQERQ